MGMLKSEQWIVHRWIGLVMKIVKYRRKSFLCYYKEGGKGKKIKEKNNMYGVVRVVVRKQGSYVLNCTTAVVLSVSAEYWRVK